MHRRNVQRENDTRVLAGMLMSKELQAEEWGCTSNEEGEQESNAFFFVVVSISDEDEAWNEEHLHVEIVCRGEKKYRRAYAHAVAPPVFALNSRPG